MKKLIVAVMLLMCVGCTTSTRFGQCIGAFDDKDPKLHYKLSAWNVAMAILFSETIFVPIIVVVDEALCPTGTK